MTTTEVEELAGVPEAKPAGLIINKLTKHQLSSNWDRVTGDLSSEFFVTIDDPDAGSNTIQYMKQADYDRLRASGGLFEWQYYATPGLGDDPADISDLLQDAVQQTMDRVLSGDDDFTGNVTFHNLDVRNQEEVSEEDLWRSQVFINLDGEFRKVGFQTVYNAIINRAKDDGWFAVEHGDKGDQIGQNLTFGQCEEVLSVYGFPVNRSYDILADESSAVRHLGSSAANMYSDCLLDKRITKTWTVGGDVGNGLILGYTPSSGIIRYNKSTDTFNSGYKMSDKLKEWWTNGGGGTQNKTGAWAMDIRIYNHAKKSDKVKILFGIEHSVQVGAGDQFLSLEDWRIANGQTYPTVKAGDTVKITNRICATSSVPFSNGWRGDIGDKGEIEWVISQSGWTAANGWNRFSSGNLETAVNNMLIRNSIPSSLAGTAVLKTMYGSWFGLNVWKVA